MTTLGNLLFLLVCTGLLLHEMDAVHEREWRLLYGLRRIENDERARRVFIWLHLPLFVGLALVLTHDNPSVRDGARLAVEVFAIVHSGLHARIRARGSSAFGSWSSQSIIHGTALAALLSLAWRTLA